MAKYLNNFALTHHSTFQARVGDTIKAESNVYKIVEVLRPGLFGEVITCRKNTTEERFVLKCKKINKCAGEREVDVLSSLRSLNPDKNHIVKLIENFTFKDRECFAFEKLNLNLHDFMNKQNCTPLKLRQIRGIAYQMLVALRALKHIGLTHGNIMPENILFVDHVSQPFNVKLAGFENAIATVKLSEVPLPPSCGYGAPEIFWDRSLGESSDVWSLGCTLAYLFLGQSLYPTDCEYNYLKFVVKLHGKPDNSLLDKRRQTRHYFTQEKKEYKHTWRLKTTREYCQATGMRIKSRERPYDHLESLDDLRKTRTDLDSTELDDLEAFIDFLKSQLKLNPQDRVLPDCALDHSFITMDHLQKSNHAPYRHLAYKLMVRCGFESSDDTYLNDSDDDKDKKHPFDNGFTLSRESTDYHFIEKLGQGSFGEVFRFRKGITNEFVAMKVVHKSCKKSAKREDNILQKLRELDADKNNLIRFFDRFRFNGNFWFVFELLDVSLHDWVTHKTNKCLSISEIRPIAEQMLVALNSLKQIGITHTDIKPDNIMIVNHEKMSFRVKLIDFGLACLTSELPQRPCLQARCYRAPEVYLGFPVDESIDIWGLGCSLIYLYLLEHMYPASSALDTVKFMIKLHGMPDKNLLDTGLHVGSYFLQDQSRPDPVWKLKTKRQYFQATGIQTARYNRQWFQSLNDLKKMAPRTKDPNEINDLECFIDFIGRAQTINSADRILPADALNHDFITMAHLAGAKDSIYVANAHQILEKCQLRNSHRNSFKKEGTDHDTKTVTDTCVPASATMAHISDAKNGPCVTNVRRIFVKPKTDFNSTCTSSSKNTLDQENNNSKMIEGSIKDGFVGLSAEAAADESLRCYTVSFPDKSNENIQSGHPLKNTGPLESFTSCKRNKGFSCQNENPSHFVEVKSKRTHFKRIRKFFSRILKPITSCYHKGRVSPE